MRQEIKTIVQAGTIDFDNEVNAELKNGWRIQTLTIAMDVFVAFLVRDIFELEDAQKHVESLYQEIDDILSQSLLEIRDEK